MKVEFTVDEYIYNGGNSNNTGLRGAKIYHEDGDLVVIDYVKATKGARILKVIPIDNGKPFLINQDKSYWWEVNNELPNKPTERRKSKGKGGK